MRGALVPYDLAIVRRSLVSFAFIVLVAVGLSGCQTAITPGAAKVGSQTISSGTLTDALQAIASNKGFLCTLTQSNPSAAISVKGAGSDTFDSGFAASQLTLFIKERAMSNLLASLSITPSAAQIDLAKSRLIAELNPPSQTTCTVNGKGIVSSLASSYRTFLISVEVEQDLLAAHVAGTTFTPAGLASYAAAHQAAAYDACVSAILVSTQAKAAAARAQIEAGSSFATVAKATSTDASSAAAGGVLGCLPVNEFQAPLNADLAAMTVGQLSQPIAFSGNYVLLQVTSRKAPTEFEALNYMISAASSNEAAEVTAAEAALKVSVDPKYGRWEKVSGSYEVVPPTGPAVGDLVNSASITPPTVPLG